MDLISLEHGALVKIMSFIKSGMEFVKCVKNSMVVTGDTLL